MDKSKYPPNWDSISYNIRFGRAEGRCECVGECGLHKERCTAVNRLRHPVTGSRVVLTVAHLDQDPSHGNPDRLKAMCQRCHLVYDRNYYKKVRLAWIATLAYKDLFALLLAMESFHIHGGDEVTDEAEQIYDALEQEFEGRLERGEAHEEKT